MPEIDLQIRLIEVPILGIALAMDATDEVFRADRGHPRPLALVGRLVGRRDGRAVVSRLPGVPLVQADVDVVTLAVAGATLVAQEAPRGHLVSILDEDVHEVRDDDVGVVPQIDVDVVAEARAGGLHVNTRRTRDRGEDLLVLRVVRVQVDVVTSRVGRVAVGSVRALRAHLLDAGAQG
ncbi:MAG: hypothetical protein NUV84_03275 [Candidatus Uhrbacteria bacterium]|nr:hypothetical protein [Candidatus Uhrbacteria bacterium]